MLTVRALLCVAGRSAGDVFKMEYETAMEYAQAGVVEILR